MSFRGGKGGRGGGNRRDFSPSGPRFRDRSGRGKGGPQFMGPRGPMGPNRMMPPRMSGPRGGLLDDLPPRHDDFPMRPRMGARVLVGNLPMRVLRKDLEDKFLKYGPIVDMEVFGDYAILEFEAFISAEDAIRHEHGVPFMGQKAVVEWAKPPNPDGPMPGGGPRGLLDDQFPPEVPSLLNNIRPDVPFGRDFGPDFGPRGPMPVPEPLMPMDAPHPPFEDEFQRSRHPFREDVGSRSNAPLRDDFPASNGGARGSVGASSAPSDNPAKKGKASTDLEIIVLNKQQQRYAEMVERKLRTLGISVDLLFPREGAPIPAILNSISKRGALYAAVISPQNEKEGSITINILFGNPVERRNIPLDEAVKTIGENFDDFVRRGGKDGERVRMVIPEPIRALFSAIMEGRSVTDADYEISMTSCAEAEKTENESGW
ncbi:unnamed protein product [Notodromas monacha]|uniref:RRM domain-containing protein n=1 Tax=Notodromas monacha TaxID=399045 RepID=A0A7R9GAM1_9CRUS|nr:unnamed protein product [Notodromas monacha]CAG0915579.1 unnamed protein product [Notodromas monacha]